MVLEALKEHVKPCKSSTNSDPLSTQQCQSEGWMGKGCVPIFVDHLSGFQRFRNSYYMLHHYLCLAEVDCDLTLTRTALRVGASMSAALADAFPAHQHTSQVAWELSRHPCLTPIRHLDGG